MRRLASFSSLNATFPCGESVFGGGYERSKDRRDKSQKGAIEFKDIGE